MQTIRTIVCKLSPTPDQQAEIDRTLVAFAAACNHVAGVCRAMPSTNKVDVQRECYRAVRADFGLSANLTIRAIRRTCAALKVPEKADSVFDPTSIDYDVRIFRYREKEGTFRLTLLQGPHRIAAVLGTFQRDALHGRKPTSATLVRRHDGGYYLHVQLKDDAPAPLAPTAFLGVDLGIVNLAADSEGNTYSGATIDRNRKRRATGRKQHQRKGTKSAKRKLKRLSRKQARFQAHVNHEISKKLVASAKALNSGIALEDLTGIRERIEDTVGKRYRRRFGNWSFFQLRGFIEYKARRAGVPVVFVDPRNTSRTCSQCGHCEKANRKSQAEFVCLHCGHSEPADTNAAVNIGRLGRLVDRPQKQQTVRLQTATV